jgi:hypothetical protein
MAGVVEQAGSVNDALGYATNMTTKRAICLVLVAILVILVAVVVANQSWTPDSLEQVINQDLSVGCDIREVKQWLSSKGLRFDQFTSAVGDQFGGKTIYQLAGIKEERAPNCIRVISHRRRGLRPYAKYFYFFFDQDQALIGKFTHTVDLSP